MFYIIITILFIFRVNFMWSSTKLDPFVLLAAFASSFSLSLSLSLSPSLFLSLSLSLSLSISNAQIYIYLNLHFIFFLSAKILENFKQRKHTPMNKLFNPSSIIFILKPYIPDARNCSEILDGEGINKSRSNNSINWSMQLANSFSVWDLETISGIVDISQVAQQRL